MDAVFPPPGNQTLNVSFLPSLEGEQQPRREYCSRMCILEKRYKFWDLTGYVMPRGIVCFHLENYSYKFHGISLCGVQQV